MVEVSGSMLAAPADAEIAQEVLAGNLSSFEVLMRRYNRRLYRIARGVLRNEAEAEEAVQEAYLLAYANLAQFQGTGSMAGWLAKITVNEALTRLRRGRGATATISLDDPGQREGATIVYRVDYAVPDPEQHAARAELRRVLESAIDDLPEAYRLIFILRGVEEMSVAETAEALNLEPATVKTRYHRAKRILQQQLSTMVEATVGETFPFAGARCDRIVAGVFARLGPGDRPPE